MTTALDLAGFDRPIAAPAAALHSPWPVCPGTIAGLTASLPPAALEVLNDAQLAALTDWSDPACVAATMGEATRRDIADRRAELAAPVTPAPVTPAPEPVTAPDVTAPSTGKRGPSTWHTAVLEAYREAREVWEARAEAETAEYAWEMAEFREFNPPPTFKAFLRAARCDQ